MADGTPAPQGELRELALDLLQPYKNQSRKKFDPEALAQLAESIRAHGVVQPIVARELPEGGRFEILAGERRWRASGMAGKPTIPTLVRPLDDEAAEGVHLVENLQRADLTLLEEIGGCSALVAMHERKLQKQPDPQKRTALDLAAESVGMSKAWVSRRSGFAKLSQETRDLVEKGHVTSIDIAYLIDEVAEYDAEDAEGIRASFINPQSWDPPPTRRQLEEDVKQLKQRAEANRKAEERLAKEAEKQRKALEAQAKKTGKSVEELAKAAKIEPPKGESEWDRERRLKKERARLLAPPLRKFAREQRKAILAAMPPLKQKWEGHFTFTVGIPDHAIEANTPKNPEAVRYHFEVRGSAEDAGRLIEAIDPKQTVGVSLSCTIAQLRQIEQIMGEPIGVHNVEHFKATGKQLANAVAVIAGKSAITAERPEPAKESAKAPASKPEPRKATAKKPAAKKAAAKPKAKKKG